MGEVVAVSSVDHDVFDEIVRIVDDAERRSAILLPDIVVKTECSFRKSPRNFAAVRVGRPAMRPATLSVCPDFADEPITRIRGILWHEIGHILDAVMGKRKWRQRTHHILGTNDNEQWADLAVERFCKVKIFYDHELVQRAGRGAFGTRPRPFGLR